MSLRRSSLCPLTQAATAPHAVVTGQCSALGPSKAVIVKELLPPWRNMGGNSKHRFVLWAIALKATKWSILTNIPNLLAGEPRWSSLVIRKLFMWSAYVVTSTNHWLSKCHLILRLERTKHHCCFPKQCLVETVYVEASVHGVHP